LPSAAASGCIASWRSAAARRSMRRKPSRCSCARRMRS
jgi:hypothetical protein